MRAPRPVGGGFDESEVRQAERMEVWTKHVWDVDADVFEYRLFRPGEKVPFHVKTVCCFNPPSKNENAENSEAGE